MSELPEQQLEKLIAAFKEGLPALAIELSRKYLLKYPDDDVALLYFGMSLQSIARYEEARKVFEDAMCLFPDSKLYLVYRQVGLLYQDRCNLSEAELWFKRAIENCPHVAGNYIYLGAMLAKNGRLDEAEIYHRKAIACHDDCIDEGFLNLGYVLRAKGEHVEAYECFRQALEIDKDYELAKNALADLEKVLSLVDES
jgi:tetratricopeptide (TPR) repeat protein